MSNHMNRVRPWIPIVLLVSYAAMCLMFLVSTEWYPQWDSAVYLVTAKNIVSGLGYTYLDEPVFLRPPGFSYLLSLIINPEGDLNFYKMNLIIMILAICALAVMYLVMIRFNDKIRAAGITLLIGTSPLFVSEFNNIMSDYLFLCLFFLGCWLLLPHGKGSKNPFWRGMLGALFIAGSMYIRSVGIVLLPGLILLGIRGETGTRRLSGVAQVLLIVAFLAPWQQYASLTAKQIPKATQLACYTYSTGMLHIDQGDPTSRQVTISDYVYRIKFNSSLLVEEIGKNILHGVHARAFLAALLVFAGFIIVCLRGWTILEWLAFSYTGVIILYFTWVPRLVLPLIIMYYHYFFVAIEYIGERSENYFKKKGLSTAMLTTAFIIVLSLNILSMPEHLSADSKKLKDSNLYTAAEWVKENTPEDATILHKYAPIFAVITDRKTYSYAHLRGAPLPDVDYIVLSGDAPEFEPQLMQQNQGSVVLPGNSIDGDIRIYRMH